MVQKKTTSGSGAFEPGKGCLRPVGPELQPCIQTFVASAETASHGTQWIPTKPTIAALAVQNVRRKCDGSASSGGEVGESSYAVRLVRIGIVMDECSTTTRLVVHPSSLLSAERTSSCCAPNGRPDLFPFLPEDAQPQWRFADRCRSLHRHD